MNYYDINDTLDNHNYTRNQSLSIGNIELLPVEDAFFCGTIFRHLYKPYKMHQPTRIIPTNEKDRLLLDVDKYYFALHEIRIFLDNDPNNQAAINIFTIFQKGYIMAKHAYESKYGALDIEAQNLDTSPWNWTVQTWPWDEVMI